MRLGDILIADADEPMTTRFFNVTSEKATGEPKAVTRFALVVGNDAYTSARLKNAGADAALVADTLRRLDFSVTLLCDSTKPILERAIVEFGLALRRAGRKAVGIFYFAGHGVQEAGQNYLLPIDAEIPDTAFLTSAAVSAQILIDELAKAPAAAKVVILDACRNNPIPNAVRATRDVRSGLAAMRDVPDGTLIVFSTAADSVALDAGNSNGPYATALAAALAAPHISSAADTKPAKLRLAVKYGMIRVPEATIQQKFELVKKIGFEGLEIQAPGEVNLEGAVRLARTLRTDVDFQTLAKGTTTVIGFSG
mgnify:CR=1 FL=1